MLNDTYEAAAMQYRVPIVKFEMTLFTTSKMNRGIQTIDNPFVSWTNNLQNFVVSSGIAIQYSCADKTVPL
ncbi:hypothetical protein D3C78_1720020 [compost metagenome]